MKQRVRGLASRVRRRAVRTSRFFAARISLNRIFAGHEALLDGTQSESDVVVLISATDPLADARAAREAWPAAEFVVLTEGRVPSKAAQGNLERCTFIRARNWRARVRSLLPGPVPSVIVDIARGREWDERNMNLRYLSFFLRDQGLYIVRTGRSEASPRSRSVLELIEHAASMSQPERDALREPDRALADSLSVAGRTSSTVVLRKNGHHLAKLRDWETNAILNRNYGRAWGEASVADEAFTFESRARIVTHGSGPQRVSGRELAVPDLNVRRYRDVTATARQILTYDRYVLPDSWRHPHQRRLNNRQLVHATGYHGIYKPNTVPQTSRRLEGAFYYLDTELPAHFGHITTDVMSRLWGWDDAQAQFPELRALVSSKDSATKVPSWQQEIFEAYGISTDRIEVIGPREAVTVDTLIGVSPLFENPKYVHPRIADDWERIQRGLPKVPAPLDTDRIFVARVKSGKRECREHDEVEALALSTGLQLFYPERHTYAEQAAMFAQCSVIAGWAGSGMFSMQYAPNAKIVLVSSDAYTACNEELIAAVLGQELHYFWGESTVAHPEGGWSLSAFTAAWSLDLDAVRDEFVEATSR